MEKAKSGIIAALLNVVIPGAGHIYCGRVFLAIVVFLLAVISAFLLIIINPPTVAFIGLVLAIDGFLAAADYNRAVEKPGR